MLSMTKAHDSQIDTYRDWISQLMIQHNIDTVSAFARRAGLTESTLTRLMNSDGPGHMPREGTIGKIERAFHTRRPLMGLGENPQEEGDFIDPRQRTDQSRQHLEEIVTGALDGQNAYTVADRALDLAGYMPDDLVLIDEKVRPQPSDIVAIRFRVSQARRGAVTLRIYDQPFLTAHSTDETLRRPLLIDPARIDILGVVTMALRQRHKSKG